MRKKGTNGLFIFLSILLSIFLLTTIANAAIYYVDQNHPQASDENPGTEELPWKTLKKACNTAQAGDTVLVKAGRYSDPNTDPNPSYEDRLRAFNPVNSGTAGNPIVFKSYPKHAAIIVGTQGKNPAWGIYKRAHIVIDGFKVEGGIIFNDVSYSIIENCDVSVGYHLEGDPSCHYGIWLHFDTHHCIIRNNYVHDMENSVGTGNHNTAGIMVMGQHAPGCRYNLIEHNDVDAGPYVYSSYGQKAGYIYNNTWRWNIARNANTGFLGMARTDESAGSEDNIYYQNIIINCSQAFELSHMCYRFQIYNNVAYNCPIFLKAFKNDNTNTQLWNNIAWGKAITRLFIGVVILNHCHLLH